MCISVSSSVKKKKSYLENTKMLFAAGQVCSSFVYNLEDLVSTYRLSDAK